MTTLGTLLYGLKDGATPQALYVGVVAAGAEMSFDHSACDLSAFCRNPLHPGPCKGWKKRLGIIAPGALTAIEKAHHEKVAAKRVARAAAKSAAEKKVASGPAHVLAHPKTAKQATIEHANILLGDAPHKATGKASKVILNKAEIKKYSKIKSAQVAALGRDLGYVDASSEKEFAGQLEKQIADALAKDNVDGGDANYRKVIGNIATTMAAGFADHHCGVGQKDGDCDGLLWESLRTRAEFVLENALASGNPDQLNALKKKLGELGDDREALGAYLKSVGVDPAKVKKEVAKQPEKLKITSKKAAKAIGVGTTVEADTSSGWMIPSGHQAVVGKIDTKHDKISGKNHVILYDEEGKTLWQGPETVHLLAAGGPEEPSAPKLSGFEKGEKTKMDKLAQVAADQDKANAGADALEKLAVMTTGKKTPEHLKGALANAVAKMQKGEAAGFNESQVAAGVATIAQKTKTYTGAELGDAEKAALTQEILDAVHGKGDGKTPLLDLVHKMWSSNLDNEEKQKKINAAFGGGPAPLTKWQQKSVDIIDKDPSDAPAIIETLDVLGKSEFDDLPDAEKAKVADWVKGEVAKGNNKAGGVAEDLGIMTHAEVQAAKPKAPEPAAGPPLKSTSEIVSQALTPSAGLSPHQQLNVLDNLTYSEYQQLPPATKAKADKLINDLAAKGSIKAGDMAKDFDVPQVTPSPATPPPPGTVNLSGVNVADLSPTAVEAGALAQKLKSGTAKMKLKVYEDLADDPTFGNMSPLTQKAVLDDLDAMHAKFLDPKKKAQVSKIKSKLQAAQGGGAGTGGAGSGTSPVSVPNATPPTPAAPVTNGEKAAAGAKFLSDVQGIIGQPEITKEGQGAAAKIFESLHNNGPAGESGFTNMAESLVTTALPKSGLGLPPEALAKFGDPLAADFTEKLKASGAPTPVFDAWAKAVKAFEDSGGSSTPDAYAALVALDAAADKWHNDHGEPDALQGLIDAVPSVLSDEDAATKYAEAFVGLKHHAAGQVPTAIGKANAKKLYLNDIKQDGQAEFVKPGTGMSQAYADGLASLHLSGLGDRLGLDPGGQADWKSGPFAKLLGTTLADDYQKALVNGQAKPEGVAGAVNDLADEVRAQAKKVAADNGWSEDSIALEQWKKATFQAKVESLLGSKPAGAGGASTAVNPAVANPSSPLGTVDVPKDLPELGENEEPALGGGAGIGHLADSFKHEMGATFKAQPTGAHSSDQPELVYDSLLALAAHYGGKPEAGGPLSILQAAQVIDEWKAKQYGSENKHLTEKKLVSWLGTQAGKDYAEKFATPKEQNLDYVQNPHKAKPQEKVVYLAPGLKVQDVGGPGKYDPKLTTADFKGYTTAQAIAQRKKYFKDTGESWTPGESAALTVYTGGSYHSINNYMRGIDADTSAAVKDYVVKMQSAMRPLTENHLLLRGSSYKIFPEGFRNIEGVQKLIGQEIQDDGFVSTSVAGSGGEFTKQVKLHIEAPKGTMGVFVDDISSNKGENEMILAAGTKYRILGVENPYSSQPIIRLRVIS